MKSKLELLQIGRGIAAILVVMLHITGHAEFYMHFSLLGGAFSAGWTGVDFFFVLSGFIIYYVHKDDLGHPEKLSLYFKKRLIRIYPIYWIIASVALALSFINKNSITNDSLSRSITDVPYLVRSYLLIESGGIAPFLGVAWSLCYEIFFYFLFGVAILFGKRIFAVLGLAFLIAITCFQYIPAAFRPWLYLLPSNFNLEFIFGVTAAYLSLRIRWDGTSKWKAQVCLALGILLFVTAYFLASFYKQTLSKINVNSRLAFGTSAFLIILAASKLRLVRSSKFYDFLMLLGDASYVLYLSHPLVLAFFFKIYSKTRLPNNQFWDVLVCFVSLVISVGIAIFIHNKIERKLNKYLSGILIPRQVPEAGSLKIDSLKR
jgi:exopolysaccharide production protein ExoZ